MIDILIYILAFLLLGTHLIIEDEYTPIYYIPKIRVRSHTF